MSTYYYFACDRCKEYGGWFSRQAWGWGNMDIIDTFAFLADHAEHVDHHEDEVDLRVISEHDTYELHRQGWVHVVGPEEYEGLADYERLPAYEHATFPHSNDWERQKELFAAYLAKKNRPRGGDFVVSLDPTEDAKSAD